MLLADELIYAYRTLDLIPRESRRCSGISSAEIVTGIETEEETENGTHSQSSDEEDLLVIFAAADVALQQALPRLKDLLRTDKHDVY